MKKYIDMLFLIFVLFFSSNFSSEMLHVQKRTAASGLLALTYFSYKYGPKAVAKKLQWTLPLFGILAGVQNKNKKCALISTAGFGLSIFSYLAYTHRKFLASRKALPLYSILLGVSVGIKKKDKKFVLGSLGVLPIYFAYYYRKVLFTKRKLFQFFCCALLIGGGYKFFTHDRITLLKRTICHWINLLAEKSKLPSKVLYNIFCIMMKLEFSSIFSSLIFADALKHVLKKYNFSNKIHSPLSCMAYIPILFFFEISNNLFFNFSEIKRPSWYDEAVSLKTKRTRCFYFPQEGKDHTATLCGRLESERVFDSTQLDQKSIANIIGMIIKTFSKEDADKYQEDYKIKIDENLFDKLKHQIKIIFEAKEELSEGEGWYWDEHNVRFSKKRFEMVAKLYSENQKLNGDIDSEEFARTILMRDDNTIENQIKEWANKEVCPGRVFDQEVSFGNVLELIKYIFLNENFDKDNFQYIFSKDIDMRWKAVLDKEILENNDLRYIAINMLYGIFCDTCAINFRSNFNIFKHTRSWCFGCEDHIDEGFLYGPMTILEHMILNVREDCIDYGTKKDLRDKLIELGIVKRSFFAPIQL